MRPRAARRKLVDELSQKSLPSPAPIPPPTVRLVAQTDDHPICVMKIEGGYFVMLGNTMPNVGDIIEIEGSQLVDGVARECVVVERRWRVQVKEWDSVFKLATPTLITRTLPAEPSQEEQTPQKRKR